MCNCVFDKTKMFGELRNSSKNTHTHTQGLARQCSELFLFIKELRTLRNSKKPKKYGNKRRFTRLFSYKRAGYARVVFTGLLAIHFTHHIKYGIPDPLPI